MILSFSLNGFGCISTLKDISDSDIDDVENFVANQLMRLLELKAVQTKEALDANVKKSFFCDYSNKPECFRYTSEERCLILKCAKYLTCIDSLEELNIDFSHFGFKNYNVHDIPTAKKEVVSNPVDNTSGNEKTLSRTHFLLNLLLTTANQNVERKKEGYRFDEKVKELASYYRMIAGPMAYETLQKNLELSLPSLSSVNRYIRKMNTNIVEGVLRTHELAAYLKERELPLTVALSEDATRITGVVQYDVRTNQLMGFALPINSTNGIPIPYSFKARTADEIMRHFIRQNEVGHFVNVIMAQPIANVDAFCLLLFASDSKYTSLDVSNRWTYIIEQLEAVHISVIVISSDSDPKYNSAMRRDMKLGIESSIFRDNEWFRCGREHLKAPFCVQDTVHVGGKMRNRLLKTMEKPRMLPLGKKYFIRLKHLVFLIDNFTKDKHQLTASVLNPVDKMNFPSVLRICDQKVIDLLYANVKDSMGTITYLGMMRDIIDSYRDKDLLPLDRVRKIWYPVFICRIWKEYVLSRPSLTIENNFLTQNCYSCIELNAHSLILILLNLKEANKPHLFKPEFFESQPCEQMFRQIRSFTSTYSTVANCSIKEIINRINKIQLQNDIALHCTDFEFPRIKTHSQGTGYRVVDVLPSKEEICSEIERCQIKAMQFAVQIGLREKKDAKKPVKCGINELRERNWYDHYSHNNENDDEILPMIGHIDLKDFSYKFEEAPDECSPFVEIFCGKNGKKMVIKKSSLCWLLRKDTYKPSSDRLHRVRLQRKKKNPFCIMQQQKKIKFRIQKKRKTKTKLQY